MSAIHDEWTTDEGSVRLLLGDCLDVLPGLDDGSIQAVVTDPPYSSGGMVRGDRMQSTRTKYQSSDVQSVKPLFSGDNRDQRGYLAWCSVWLMHLEQVLAPGSIACLFSDWRQLPTTTDALQSGGFVWRGIVPWDKCNARPMPNRFTSQCEYVIWGTNGPRDFSTEQADYHPGIIRCPAPTGDDREHATQKPVEAIIPLVSVAGVGEFVIDPFMGSGTTALACLQTGRRFVGIEKEPKYFEIAKKRIKNELAKTALIETPKKLVQTSFMEAVS